MGDVLKTSWALFLGMFLLMVGNGIQGSLLGVRGGLEGFSTSEMSIVMTAYFAGFFGGSRLTPAMIRRVGHVRVFAALGSFISAVLILYPTITEPWAWSLLRLIIGFCFSGVYVTAESWLNNATGNENRGKSLSLYMIVQMFGVVTGQGLLAIGDPSGFVLFVIPSVLVSISFAPILLSISPTPAFEATKPLSLRDLFAASPLGCVGMFFMGGVFAAQFSMASVYAIQAGFSVRELSLFIAIIYMGAMLFQYPIGWISDRVDRRLLILIVSLIGGIIAFAGFSIPVNKSALFSLAFVLGGMSNPLYSLLLAYVNDNLPSEDMAAAAGGMVFISGMGSISGPLATGWMMSMLGPRGFWAYMSILLFALAGYAAYRMTQRSSAPVTESGEYVGVFPNASAVTVEAAQEWVIEAAEEMEEETTGS